MEKVRNYKVEVIGIDGIVLDSFTVELTVEQLHTLEVEPEFICTLVK